MSLLDAIDLEGCTNIRYSAQEAVVTLYCDLTQDFGASGTGKTTIIASTNGGKPLGTSFATLALYLFIKDPEARDLSDETLAPLTGTPVQLADGLQWGMEPEDPRRTLRIVIDFAAVTERSSASGKTVLLARTTGSVPVGATGVFCMFNCYRRNGVELNLDGLLYSSSANLVCGAPAVELGEHATIQQTDERTVAVSVTAKHSFFTPERAVLTVRTTLLCWGACVQVLVMPASTRAAAPEQKRRRLEKEEEEPAAAAAADATATHKLKLRNTTLTLNAAAEGRLAFTLAFDPTVRGELSSSGRSMVLATTAGFQTVTQGGFAFKVSLNVTRGARPPSDEEVKAAVEAVLGRKDRSSLQSLRFSRVMPEILDEMGLAMKHADLMETPIKRCIGDYMRRA